MKRTTTAELIAQLISEGHQVEFYERPSATGKADGLRITKIDDKRYSMSGGEGNNAARAMLGAPLSRAQRVQRRRANPMTGVAKLTAKQKSYLRKANKSLKKTKEIKITEKTLRKRKTREGWTRTAASLRNTVRHFVGYAYRGNVDWFIGVLEQEGVMPNTRNWLSRHKNTTEDTALVQAHEYYYQAKHGDISYEQADSDAMDALEQGRKRLREQDEF